MSAEGQHLCSDVLDACTADQDVRGLCRSGSNDQAQRADVEVPMLGPADERAVLAAEEARRCASAATPVQMLLPVRHYNAGWRMCLLQRIQLSSGACLCHA